MKILIASHFFHPSIGGVETFALTIAKEFVNLGHKVKLITGIPSCKDDIEFPFEVYRQPNPLKTAKLIKWSDVYLQNSISLKYLLPNILVDKPCVIIFQGPIGQNWLIHNLKYYFLRKYNVVSVSQGIGKLLGDIEFSVIHNTFESGSFKNTTQIQDRTKHLVFLGRLIKDKGIDIVLNALALLKKKDIEPTFTIIGPGSKKENLQELTKKLKLEKQVNFVGPKSGNELTDILNQHQIMIVPSNYPEAFGIVALEGIACGCTIIASDSYGLPEAVGKCGILFKMGNVKDCANKIEQLVNNTKLQISLTKEAKKHLESHTPNYIAKKYVTLFQNILHS